MDADELGQALASLLTDKVLVFPDNRIEIQWKVSGFGCIDAAGADDFVSLFKHAGIFA